MSERDPAPSGGDQLARQAADFMWAQDRASAGLGMEIEAVGEGWSRLAMTVSAEMVNGLDICHGGFVFSLADSAFAFACNSQNQAAVAAGVSIDFLRPAKLGDRLTAEAAVVNQSRRSGLYDIVVRNQNQQIIAQVRGRSMRIGGPVITTAAQ
ncbi:hydroxyphenylacetyl-CoA thioesterase PaaI [Gammaproteobacteria bacterium LSUCC0057]|uniref:Hydroxyphenylacetyl-CoA thioesterase PaaI n=1 Tax=Gammaproteobacteria bacterium LSUCC0057 TaxID=2559237 RepID=A0A4Y8UK21_9GAMM|nr:hydroxyphenylacetyl-CoA thioesterase PaaI [Gammaproteobacteria bacterium LSUCC0057]